MKTKAKKTPAKKKTPATETAGLESLLPFDPAQLVHLLTHGVMNAGHGLFALLKAEFMANGGGLTVTIDGSGVHVRLMHPRGANEHQAELAARVENAVAGALGKGQFGAIG